MTDLLGGYKSQLHAKVVDSSVKFMYQNPILNL